MSGSPLAVRVAILGGTIGGAALLRGLSRYPHIAVDIYEWQPAFRVEGHAVIIKPAAEDILTRLDPALADCLDRAGAVEALSETRISAGQFAGQAVASLDIWNYRQRMVDPQRLLEELVRGIPPRMIHFNSRISSITDLSPSEGVLLKFANGTQRVYDVIIGADFRCCVSRQYVLGANHPALKARQSAWWELPIRVPYERALQALGPELLGTGTPCQTSYLGLGSYLQCDFMGGGKDVLITAKAELSGYESDGPWAKLLTPQEFSAVFASHQLPICRNMINLILSLYTVQVTGLCDPDHLPLSSYVSRSGALIDEAAHSVLSYKGGRALVALEEALVLSTLIARAPSRVALPAALSAYDHVCRPRAEEAAAHSRDFNRKIIGRDPDVGGLDPFLLPAQLQYHCQALVTTNVDAQLLAAAGLMDQMMMMLRG
ncbi:FAD/NAD(P)-binding domain-containing protein [Xylariaceae sp. FL0594]|nr:FAD/NAD(P)-binding domain-containing protein [Xylariaceae sp. FL0594]